MISLSKRLSAVAELIPPCDILADVGTDHGYLPVWLLQQGRIKHVFASDIKEGPLRKAKETAELYDLSACMETILADGLQFPGAEQAEVVTICGMGGETMISILQNAPWTTNQRRLILQPQSKLQELDHWLQMHHYAIEEAKLCLDGGKLYLAISVLGGGEWAHGTEETLFLHKDPMLLAYIHRELQKARHAEAGLRLASDNHQDLLRASEQRIAVLEHYEREIIKW